jgi:hypothetical protein
MTVMGTEPKRMERPITDGSDPKTRCQEAVAHDGEALARPIAVGAQGSAEGGHGAEHVEEGARHLRPRQALRLAGALGQIEGQTAEGGHALERAAVSKKVQEIRGGVGVLRRGRGRPPDDRDALGMIVGERPQKDGVHDAEDSGVGPDAEGQGADRQQRERTVPGEILQAAPHVLDHARSPPSSSARGTPSGATQQPYPVTGHRGE